MPYIKTGLTAGTVYLKGYKNMEPEKKYETSSIDDIKALFESRTDDNIIPLDELDGKFKPKPAATPVKASSPQYPKRKTSAQKKRNRLIANIMIYSGIALLIIMCAILVTLIFTGNNGDSIKGLEITNSGDITLRIGHSEKLKVKTEPSDTEYALSYVSADTSVATVSLDGKITGVSDGKTEITVSSGELSDSIIVIVKKDIIEKLDVSLAALSLDGGEEQKVTAKLTPSDAKDVSLSWKSADTEVATVDKDGNIKGVNTGETTVTVTDSVTGLSKDISVTVNGLELPDSMEFDKKSVTLEVGEVYNSVLKFSPEDITHTSAIYYTSDATIASVTNEGVITAKSEGSCTIEAYYENDFRLVATMEVNIIDPYVITQPETTVPETPKPETSKPQTSEPQTPSYNGSHKMEVIDGITYFDGVMIANKTYTLPASYNPGVSLSLWTLSTICRLPPPLTAFRCGSYQASVHMRIRMLYTTAMLRRTAEMPQIHILHVRVIRITRQDTHSILILSNRTSSTIRQVSGLTRTATSTALSSVILKAKKAPQAICMSRGTSDTSA